MGILDAPGIGGAEAASLRADTAQALLLSRGVTYADSAKSLSKQIVFTKTGALFDTSDTGADFPSLYWPWIIRVDAILDDPLGKYYLYFSTDHGQTDGCIGLATADEVPGPYTQRGKTYQFNETVGGSGTESETPSVIYDEDGTTAVGAGLPVDPSTDTITKVAHGLPNGQRVTLADITTVTGLTEGRTYYVVQAAADTFKLSATRGGAPVNIGGSTGTATATAVGRFVLYHQQVSPTGAKASQVTMRAYGLDGVTWTPGGIALDVPFVSGYPAPNHFGYFRPFRRGEQWVAYSLMAGETNSARSAISYSDDGSTWDIDDAPLGSGQEWFDASENLTVSWIYSSVVLWRGQHILVCLIGPFSSGGAVGAASLGVAPLAPNMRNVTSRPGAVMESITLPWENGDIGQPFVFVDDGKLWCIYRNGDGTPEYPFTFGAAYAEAL